MWLGKEALRFSGQKPPAFPCCLDSEWSPPWQSIRIPQQRLRRNPSTACRREGLSERRWVTSKQPESTLVALPEPELPAGFHATGLSSESQERIQQSRHHWPWSCSPEDIIPKDPKYPCLRDCTSLSNTHLLARGSSMLRARGNRNCLRHYIFLFI